MSLSIHSALTFAQCSGRFHSIRNVVSHSRHSEGCRIFTNTCQGLQTRTNSVTSYISSPRTTDTLHSSIDRGKNRGDSGNRNIYTSHKQQFPNLSNILHRDTSSCSGNTDIEKMESTKQMSHLVDEMLQYLPLPFLFDSDKTKFDPVTHQKLQLDTDFDPIHGKPILSSPTNNKTDWKNLHIEQYWIDDRDTGEGFNDEIIFLKWSNGIITQYSASWIKQQIQIVKEIMTDRQPSTTTPSPSTSNISSEYPVKKILWDHLQESTLRSSILSLPFQSIIDNDQSMYEALRIFYQYGILLVTDTPYNDQGAAVAAFAAAVSGGSVKQSSSISLLKHYRQNHSENTKTDHETKNKIMLPDGTDGPLRTLYGSVWSTASTGMPEGGSVADSAYGQGSLPLHTDMTYLHDPPGLQVSFSSSHTLIHSFCSCAKIYLIYLYIFQDFSNDSTSY